MSDFTRRTLSALVRKGITVENCPGLTALPEMPAATVLHLMDKNEAVSLAIAESRANGGDRRYAVPWPDGHWTVETRKPSLASGCLLAVDGVLEHA